MTDKLLPCPFCGGEAELEEIPGSPFTDELYTWGVGCKNCNIGWYIDDKIEAIAAWNRRAGGWIAVTERLPEKGECLVVSDGTVYPASVIFGEDFKHCTHWMPLPQPPELQEGGAE